MSVMVFIELLAIMVKSVDVQIAPRAAHLGTCALSNYMVMHRHRLRNLHPASEWALVDSRQVFDACSLVVLIFLTVQKGLGAALGLVLTGESSVVEHLDHKFGELSFLEVFSLAERT